MAAGFAAVVSCYSMAVWLAVSRLWWTVVGAVADALVGALVGALVVDAVRVMLEQL